LVLEDVLEKPVIAFRTIGEMATELGVRTHILRYWEEQFPMLRPLKRAGGRRHYRAEDVALLHTINRLLNADGYTIKGARQFLSNKGAPSASVANSENAINGHSPVIAASHSASLGADFHRDLRAIRNRLAAALAEA
jgi:DNA-binding transcriptional MerR regulator